jgi:PAS domain-containing protein
MAGPEPELWERQPGESPQAFAAFSCYRDMEPGERAYRKVSAELGKNKALLAKWMRVHHWVERVAAFDADNDRRLIERTHNMRGNAITRHARVASALMGQIVKRISEAQQANKTMPANELRTLSAALESAARTEARALGIGDRLDVVGVGSSQGLPMSEDERAQRLADIRAELDRRSRIIDVTPEPAALEASELVEQPVERRERSHRADVVELHREHAG